MSRYELWVFLHVASVIVWIGAGTTLALIAFYAQRTRDRLLLERLAGLNGWLGQRVFASSALAALGFGIAAARSGHWSSPLWIRLGYGAFAISILLNVAVRLPLLRRIRRGATSTVRGARLPAESSFAWKVLTALTTSASAETSGRHATIRLLTRRTEF